MQYEGDVYRPPSEASSLIVQAAIGCAHNDCTFCSMFKGKRFRVRAEDEVIRDFRAARAAYREVRRIFLADGDVLALSNERLLRLLGEIGELFPECERVSFYGSPQDVLRKTPEELAALREHGAGFVYLGAESGSGRVLENVRKGATRNEIIAAIKKIEAAGLISSVTFISGLGGRELSEEHAIETGRLISEAEPSYASLLTLLLDPAAPMYEDVRAGRFSFLPPREIAAETLLMLEHTEIEKDCVFRSNHASNYISLKGTLPRDKARMMDELRAALKAGGFKDERFRLL
ncbi:MAG: radical SAM protein [Clostridiales Family XIII bacterium]|nr:radical SAM protein [Clostridiales Family XIII bacterium]